MNREQRPEIHYTLSWADLGVLLKRAKKKILRGGLIFALIACLFTLSRQISYKTQGTIREKSKQSSVAEKSFSALLLSGGATTSESTAISTIKSRRVLEAVAKEKNLQATIKEKDYYGYIIQKISAYLSNIVDNIIVEKAYLTHLYKPVIASPPQDFIVSRVDYEGEIALALELQFTDDQNFTVFNDQRQELGQGVLGEHLIFLNAQFTLNKNSEKPLNGRSYILSFNPLHRIAESLLGNLVVEADKLDKTLIKVSFQDSDRYRSGELLNTIMNAYRNFLVQEHVRVAAEQIDYLKVRQEDMDSQLVQLMEDHAVNMSSNDASIEFLVKTQQSYKTKMLNIDLEMKHLEKAQEEGIAFFERHSADGDSPVVQNLLGEIRKYRQQADALDITLRHTHVHSLDSMQFIFNQYVDELQETTIADAEARSLLAEVEKGGLPSPPDMLMTNATYMVRPWYDKLQQAHHLQQKATTHDEKLSADEEYARCQTHFSTYLINLLHLFEVQKKMIEDRLTHQQNSQQEFQGIDSETANALFITYSRELHSLEADLTQKEFVIQQLSQPEFEVSSINSIIDDSISREIINKTSSLMFCLKDEHNRTTKEMERLQRDIDLQKGFLIVHLKQMCDILRLREQLLEDKIHALQSVTLELVRQKISIQEKHLADYINSRLNNLKHERYVISQHQDELQQELDLLPVKWASQKLIDQHMQSNLNIVHQIASMIEAKTIAENLEVSESAPFDTAVIPVLPRDPHLFLFGAIGGLGGAFLTACFCLVQSSSQGIEATEENLRHLQQAVAGQLKMRTNFSDIENVSSKEIEVLRKILMILPRQEKDAKNARRLVLIEGQGPHYAAALAFLLAKRGLKVLLVPLTADSQFLQALEQPGYRIEISKDVHFDYITGSSSTFYANELIESVQFEPVLNKLSEGYDWVISYTDADPLSVQAQSLLSKFAYIAVSIDGERLEELATYLTISENGSKLIFVTYSQA